MKRPSAWIPVAMSLIALAIVLIHIARFGTAREADEGTAAHLWQILMAGQLPIIAFFAIKWLPRTPQPALVVLALQAIAGLAAMAPVFYFRL
jgi:predicted exporter